jgi:hypothetical protein
MAEPILNAMIIKVKTLCPCLAYAAYASQIPPRFKRRVLRKTSFFALRDVLTKKDFGFKKGVE